ncbi:MAG TPA: SdrD B-like domain-containing protein [Candidatus Paceibacterota bacterium]|nr:SdrD B-like domain-containing protein [Candidatus Paceibacterota bacterium]
MKTNTLMSLKARSALVAGAATVIFASAVMLAYAAVVPTVTTTITNSGNTQVSSVPIGTAVFANATVASSSATSSPSGTVTFNRYENNSCSGTPTMQSGVSLVNGMASSTGFNVPATGLSYRVHYDGQSGFFSSADSSCVSVMAQGSSTALATTLSSTSVYAGSSVSETSTLSGANSTAGGSVSYVVYSDNSCSTAWQGAGVRAVSNAIVPASDSVLFNSAGAYYWRAVYSGDANNAAATSSCLALSVLATSTSPTSSAMISGTVYNDLNGNLGRDSGENGITGFTVNLRQGSGFGSAVYKTASTDGNGYYSFGSLANGTYSLELVSKSGWNQQTADYGSVSIANQGSLTENFAVTANGSTVTPTSTPASISGKVYNDANKNDKLDSSEAGLAGFTINLYKGAGWWGKNGLNNPVQTVVTDSSGNYAFSNLANGTYSVEQIKKSGWKQTSDDYRTLTIKNGAGLANINFSDVAKATTTPQGANGHHDGDNDHDDQGTSTNNGNHWGWLNFWNRFGSLPWGQNK